MGGRDLYKSQILKITAEAYWERLQESGWPAEIPQEERLSIRARIDGFFSQDHPIGRLYSYYALTAVCFDAECIEETGPSRFSYYGVLLQLAEGSYGQFIPEDIVDELDEKEEVARIAFRHGGKQFSCEIPWTSDWFDDTVIDLVNGALEESGCAARFIELPVSDQMVYLAFVKPETYQRAVALGLIPDAKCVSHSDR
jgi:hypothetical protein